LMIGVDFVKDQGTKQANKLLRDRIVDLAFENGLLTLGCGDSTIRVAPPLCITKTEMEECLYLFEKSVTQAEKEF
jgi:4-aminobutyrate aminotransferase